MNVPLGVRVAVRREEEEEAEEEGREGAEDEEEEECCFDSASHPSLPPSSIPFAPPSAPSAPSAPSVPSTKMPLYFVMSAGRQCFPTDERRPLKAVNGAGSTTTF